MPSNFTPTSNYDFNPAQQVANPHIGAGPGQFERGLWAASYGAQANAAAHDYLDAVRRGDAPAAKRAGLRAGQLQQQAADAAPRVASLADVHGLGDAVDWAAGSVGGAVPVMGKAAAAALAGGVAARIGLRAPATAGLFGEAAGLGSMYPDMRDAAAMQHYQELQRRGTSAPQQADEALNQSSWQGAAQLAPFALAPALSVPSRIAGRASMLPAAKSLSGAMARAAAAQGAAGAGSEYIGQQFQDQWNPDRDRSHDAQALVDAGAGNAVVGAPFGALGHNQKVASDAIDKGVQLAGAAGRGAEWVFNAATGGWMKAADEAAARAPRSLDDAAETLGKAGASVANKAEDAFTRFRARNDADLSALLGNQKGMDPTKLQVDNESKHAALDNMLARMQEAPEQFPEPVRAALEQYAGSSRMMDSWRPVRAAVRDWKKSKDFSDAFSEFTEAVGKAGAGARNFMDDVKDVYSVARSRENAQDPMHPDVARAMSQSLIDDHRDAFSPILEKALQDNVPFETAETRTLAARTLAFGMRQWVEKGFKLSRDGTPYVPPSLFRLFKNPEQAVETTVNLMRKQGLIDDKQAALLPALKVRLTILDEARKHAGSIIEDNMLPTAQEAGQYSGQDHLNYASELTQKLETDTLTKADQTKAREHFGPRTSIVLNALRENALRAEGRRNGGSRTENAGETDKTSGEGAEYGAPETQADTSYHFQRPDGETFYREGYTKTHKDGYVADHGKQADDVKMRLEAGGSKVTKVGAIDYLRERYSDQPEKFAEHLMNFLDKHGEELSHVKGSKAQEDAANKMWYVLRAENHGGRDGAMGIHPREFDNLHYKSESNKWGEYAEGDAGTSAHGRIWLEKLNGDGGEPTEFATSAHKLISHAINARGRDGAHEEIGGLAGQLGLLHEGLSAVLSSKHEDQALEGRYGKHSIEGAPVLSGRIGVKDTAGGPIRWLKQGDPLPDNLKMLRKGETYGAAKKAQERARLDEGVRAVEAILEKKKDELAEALPGGKQHNFLRHEVENLEGVVRNKFPKAIEAMRRKYAEYEGTEHDSATGEPVGGQGGDKGTGKATAIDGRNTFATREEALQHAAQGKSATNIGTLSRPVWVPERKTVAGEAKGDKREVVTGTSKDHKFASREEATAHAGIKDKVVNVGTEDAPQWAVERATDAAAPKPSSKYGDINKSSPELETEGMTKQQISRSRTEDGEGMRHSNDYASGGGELHPDEKAAAKDYKQTAWVVDALRKGLPAFMQEIAKIPEKNDKRAIAIERLRQLAQVKDANDPALAGVKVANVERLAQAAQNALKRLDAETAERKAKADEHLNPKSSAAVEKKADANVSLEPKSSVAADVLADAIAKHRDYLDNPPKDYTPEGARQRQAWAEKQLKRVEAEQAKVRSTEDYDRQDQLADYKFGLENIISKAKEMVAADKYLEQSLGPQDGGVRASAQGPMPAGEVPKLTPEERTKFFDDVARRLGKDMKAAIEESGLFGGKNGKTPISGEWTQGMIKASVFARNIHQVGAHEAFHEFFDRLTDAVNKGIMAPTKEALTDADTFRGALKVVDILTKAANSAPVVRQLERLLHEDPNALKQLKGASAEERMAYMFQFHQAGLLKIGPETASVFTKVANFFRRVAGLLSDDQKADAILRALDEGKMQTADAAAKVLADNIEAREKMYKAVNEKLAPLTDRMSRMVNTSETNMRRAGAEYDAIRKMFKRSVGEKGPQSMFEANDQRIKQNLNKWASSVDGMAPKDMELAAEYLHSGKKSNDPAVRKIQFALWGADGKSGLMGEMHKYMTEAGVRRWVSDGDGQGHWEPIGKVANNYFPRVYDTAMLVEKGAEAVQDLLKHNGKDFEQWADELNKQVVADDQKVTPEMLAQNVVTKLLRGAGTDLPEVSGVYSADDTGKAGLKVGGQQVGFTPWMRAVNKRELNWLSPEFLAKYGSKDVNNIVTSYIAQAVKRTEYVRRFGNDGEKLQDMLKAAHKANVAKFEGEGLKKDEAEIKALKIAKNAAKDVMALEGTLGHDINPTLRRVNNSIMVYENLRTLSTSLFSQFIDPMNLVVNGADFKDAWGAYKRGMKEVVASIKGDHTIDNDAKIAAMVGTLDASAGLATFGQVYNSQFMGGKFRQMNDALFKYNGMEGFNRGMQIAGTRAAINSIKRFAELAADKSERGDMARDRLEEMGIKASDVKVDKDGELDYTDPKIRQAIHTWVNGAVMRPNAAQRPAWASDPHYMLIWHMKQFAYTFHDLIMKRAIYQTKNFGDMGPAGVLAAAYAPIMIASDAMKSVLLTGGEPGWMRAGLGAELEHGVNRAGLFGKFQPAMDLTAPHRSILGLGGPLMEQIATMTEQSPTDAIINALPGSNVLNMMRGGPHIEVQGED